MNHPRWQGIFPAVTTKFHADLRNTVGTRYQWMTPMLHLDVSSKLVQNLKLIDEVVGVGSEHMRRPRLPLIGAERAFIEGIVRKALATRPAQYQSVP